MEANRSHNRSGSRFWWVYLLALLAGINYLASVYHARFDLTREKRYTLSKATTDLLKNLDDEVQVDVFLKGDFPAGFRKLANSTEEFLRLLKDRNGSRFHYQFISPEEEMPGTNGSYGDSLKNMGAASINLTVQKKAGQTSNIIFPVAIMHYKGKQELVNLYPGSSGRISQDEINSAEALMEYQFAKSMDRLMQTRKPGIAYAVGNGEPTDSRTYDLVQTLRQDYAFGMFDLQTQPRIPEGVDILMIVKPTQQFTEAEKLKLDQYVMRGGKLLCFIDDLIAEQDSLAFKPETVAYDRNLNLTDLFFKYGVRINPDLVMDLQSDKIPQIVGGTADNPQLVFLNWTYYPLFVPGNARVLNKNLGYISGRFVNSLDTIQVPGVKKTVLLASSAASRIISTPALISLNENKVAPDNNKFVRNAIPVAMLLEGQFTSLYKNRVGKAELDSLAAHGSPYRATSDETKMIVVGDGDMVLNDVTPDAGPLPMGWNKYMFREFQNQTEDGKYFVQAANEQFLLNCTEYLVNNAAISATRNKDIVLRLLSPKKISAQKETWQFLNIGLPVLLVLLFGWIYQYVRKRKYTV